MLRIGVFEQGWWKEACEALSHDAVSLSTVSHPSGNAYIADIGARLRNGESLQATVAANPVQLLLDNGGAGLSFLRNPDNPDDLKLLHEMCGVPLCSHFIDPLVTAFQGINWASAWQCLKSTSWIKAVWDRAQAVELQRFGVPHVVHLPMAAPDRPYDTTPLDPSCQQPIVSFVGAQNCSYFTANTAVPSATLFAGTLAHAAKADRPEVSFYDCYHDLFGLGTPISPDDDFSQQVNKTAAYFNAKLFYNAAMCMRNRDRYVIFLSRRLGPAFHLVGQGWDKAYGLAAQTPYPTAEAYFRHFREAAINLNLVNGNAETDLNMRHFEITAAGGFMLCRDQPELAECFEIGRECAVFHSETDLLEKSKYYLDHPDERVAIARAGQQRTLSQHLYSHRLDSLLKAMRLKPMPVEYATNQWWEECKTVVPRADVILDCGANVGQTARSLRELYPDAEIHSFEPVTSVFEQLREACQPIRVHPVKRAVGDRNGKALIHLTQSPEAHSLLGYLAGNPCAQWTKETGQEEVEVCTLDQWCRENDVDTQRVDVLKIDVQGGELSALRGARKLLETTKVVYLEVSFVPMYRDAPLLDDIDTFLTGFGYRRTAIYPSDQPYHWGDALYVKA